VGRIISGDALSVNGKQAGGLVGRVGEKRAAAGLFLAVAAEGGDALGSGDLG